MPYLADNESVSRQQQRRFPQHDARPAALAGLERRDAIEQPHLRFDLRRACMKMHGGALLQRLGRRQELQRAIHLRDRPEYPRRGQHHTARHFRRFDIGEIQRGALPGQRLAGRLAVDLHAAHPQTAAGGVKFDFLLFADRPRNQRSGHHGAEAFDRESAIQRQAEMSRRGLLRHGIRDAL